MRVMLSYMHRKELKWILLGIIIGFALGYAQASGSLDLLGLLPL